MVNFFTKNNATKRESIGEIFNELKTHLATVSRVFFSWYLEYLGFEFNTI